MSDNIFCIAEGMINEGQLDNFNAVKKAIDRIPKQGTQDPEL